jgi:hypothetical protein
VKLEIRTVGSLQTHDALINSALWIGVRASPKSRTDFLAISKERGEEIEVGFDAQTSQHLIRMLKQAIAAIPRSEGNR